MDPLTKKSNRMKNFEDLKEHPLIGKWYKKISAKDLEFCRAYIADNDHLVDHEFIFKVNRMWLDKEKSTLPKGWTQIADLLSASIDPMIRVHNFKRDQR